MVATTDVECPIMPSPGYVVVVRDEAPKFMGGIELPEEARRNMAPPTCTVHAVGADTLDGRGNPLVARCKEGDRVLTQGRTGATMKRGGREFEVIPFELVVGVVK